MPKVISFSFWCLQRSAGGVLNQLFPFSLHLVIFRMTYRLLLSQKAPLSPSQSDILPASKHLSLILLRTYLFSFVSDLNRNCSTNYCTTICVVYNIPSIHAISHKLEFGETYQCFLISFTATGQKCIEYRIPITLSIKMFPRTIMKMSSL